MDDSTSPSSLTIARVGEVVTGEAVGTAVRMFIATVDDRSLDGLELLRRLRVDLADLCALGTHYEFSGDIAPGGYPRLGFDTDGFAATAFDALVQRIPPEIYWSDLLPLTWETVGDVGVRMLAAQLSEAVAHAKYASLIWEASDDDELRRYAWDTEFGIFIAPRALSAWRWIHEVVRDLELYARSERTARASGMQF